MSGDGHTNETRVGHAGGRIENIELTAAKESVLRVRSRLGRPHLLNTDGTTNCPVQQVRAYAHGMTCSACGAQVVSR